MSHNLHSLSSLVSSPQLSSMPNNGSHDEGHEAKDHSGDTNDMELKNSVASTGNQTLPVDVPEVTEDTELAGSKVLEIKNQDIGAPAMVKPDDDVSKEANKNEISGRIPFNVSFHHFPTAQSNRIELYMCLGLAEELVRMHSTLVQLEKQIMLNTPKALQQHQLSNGSTSGEANAIVILEQAIRDIHVLQSRVDQMEVGLIDLHQELYSAHHKIKIHARYSAVQAIQIDSTSKASGCTENTSKKETESKRRRSIILVVEGLDQRVACRADPSRVGVAAEAAPFFCIVPSISVAVVGDVTEVEPLWSRRLRAYCTLIVSDSPILGDRYEAYVSFERPGYLSISWKRFCRRVDPFEIRYGSYRKGTPLLSRCLMTENPPRRSLRGKNIPLSSEARGPAPLQPPHSSTSQPHRSSPSPPPATSAPSGSSKQTRSGKRRKRSPSPFSLADGSNTPEPQGVTSGRLDDVGVLVGAKTSRNRLVDLLNKFVKNKRPRLSRDNKVSRIRSTHEVRPKRVADDSELHIPSGPPAGTQDAHHEGQVVKDPFAPDDYDFNQLELPDLIQIVEGIGLDGKTLPKDKLVVLCNQNRDLMLMPDQKLSAVRIPRHMFRFALPKPQAGSSPIPTVSPANPLSAGPVSHHKRRDDGQPSLIQSSTCTTQGSTSTGPDQTSIVAGATLSKNPMEAKEKVANDSVCRSESPISKQRDKGKGRATSRAPSASSEHIPTSDPAGLSQKQPTEKDVLQDNFPSLEHRRLRFPRPNPTSKLIPTADPESTELSDDDWLPPDDDQSSNDASDGIENSISDKQSPPRESIKHKPAQSWSSPPPFMKTQSQPASAGPAPEFDEFDAHGQGPCEEDKDEPQWRFKYYQLKHSLAETNRRLELVTKDLDVLSQVVSKFADVKPTASPEPKMRGGRSAFWMRLHIDTLLGRTEDTTRLPSPATDEDQMAWKIDVDVDDFQPCPGPPEASASTSETSPPISDRPKHPKATAQQLIVMRTMMQFVGVSSFRPDFAKSPSSAQNRWLWNLAFSIFIKLVECGEYPGVSLDADNQRYLKRLLNTRVRSLMKRYQQESWAEARKKSAASAVRRRARLSYTDASLRQTKKQRDRVVLAQKPLWPLSAIIQAACSDDETDHEGCLHLDSDQPQAPVHIRKLSWRSSELTDTIILLEEYKARIDVSIPKPATPKDRRSSSSNGRPPRPRLRCPNALISDHAAPSGLPIDCYSPQYLETLTPFERSALDIMTLNCIASH
ncbi:uncharacterized protein MELLADRAFT_114195 [Melampsora larici-populina 98AG31]|uniref:Uncharacterized protein n=1 Tax=Melampsora larici-populina (strain 98AG31 / pathotype 3-4-7) TaxID=747676 RepID=F4SCK2_MELLP|nr:uncharacterized protein MELLADRAFT_114195 [Melampsora larici-populina 98AG31]EGF97621.1 hypothetical protein MELLADRAFT_114195 [Melampsora larici-populina 98AG31]